MEVLEVWMLQRLYTRAMASGRLATDIKPEPLRSRSDNPKCIIIHETERVHP